MVTDSNELLGQTLGTCTLQRLLGQGGMGAVYLAQQSRPRRSVAVKVLMPTLGMGSDSQAAFLVRFRREADAIAALDHVNIMPIYEYGEQERAAYLVMPYVTGGTLRDRLAQNHALSLSEAVSIIEQAAAALDYAHARGIVHRDIKPANMLFHSDGRLLLADFGLAKMLKPGTEAVQETVTRAGVVIGTPEYFSPEQASGNLVDRSSDIYSLGIVLFQMLTGHVPFTGATLIAIALKHMQAEPPSVTHLNPLLPRSVEAVVMKALAKKPEHRYISAGQLAQALRAAAFESQASQASQAALARMTPMILTNNDTLPEVPAVHNDAAVMPGAPTVAGPYEQPVPSPFSNPVSPIPQQPRRRHGAVILLSSLLICSLLLGGIAASMFLPRTPAKPANNRNPHPTATATPQNVQITPAIPAGAQIYGTELPGTGCDTQGGQWSRGSNAIVTCGSSATELSDSLPRYLAGTFLDGLPGGSGIPIEYILQVQIPQIPASQGTFGVFFRNQPGSNHQGTYSFLLTPQGKWQAYSYDDKTGRSTLLTEGPIKLQSSAPITIDIVIQTSTFTFYLNGVKQGQLSNPLYPSGTLGLAVDGGSDAFFTNLALYSLP